MPASWATAGPTRWPRSIRAAAYGHSGTTRRARGSATMASASITCCSRPKPPTGLPPPASTRTTAGAKRPAITPRCGSTSAISACVSAVEDVRLDLRQLDFLARPARPDVGRVEVERVGGLALPQVLLRDLGDGLSPLPGSRAFVGRRNASVADERELR